MKGAQPCRPFKLLTPRTARRSIRALLRLCICGDSLQRPQEMNPVTSFLPQPSLLCVPRAGRTAVRWLVPPPRPPTCPRHWVQDGCCPGMYSGGAALGPQAVGAQGLAMECDSSGNSAKMVVGVTCGTWGAVGPATKVHPGCGLPLSLASLHAVISPLAITNALQLSPENVPFEFGRTRGVTEEQTWVVAQAGCQPWGLSSHRPAPGP